MSIRARFSFVALLALATASGCAAEAEDTDQGGSADAVRASTAPDAILDVPFYFGVPKTAIDVELNRQGYAYPTIWNPSKQSKDVGLRVLAVKQNGTDPESKRAARDDMSRQLARSGVLQDGDVALTFRPELQDTMAYPHIQMGATHASLVYTDGGSRAFNVDSPLDGEYVGSFDTKHFVGGTYASGERDEGTDGLHILRPHGWDDARRGRLRGWASKAASNRVNGKVRFQSNYLAPIFATQGKTTQQTVTELGKAILGMSTDQLNMYCSEFAWHMLALSGCGENEIRSAGPAGASCVDPVFAPMPFVATDDTTVGLAEGPLLSLMGAGSPNPQGLMTQIFSGNSPGKLSSGHRAVAQQVQPFMDALVGYYGARLQGASPAMIAQQAAASGQAPPEVPPNYSPTAFLVQAMKPGARKVDYVATVVFVDGDAAYQKAKSISMPSGSSIPR